MPATPHCQTIRSTAPARPLPLLTALALLLATAAPATAQSAAPASTGTAEPAGTTAPALIAAPARITAPAVAQTAAPARHYFPPKGQWERRSPAEVGMDPALIDSAVAYAIANETSWPHDLRRALEESSLTANEWGEIIGPVRDRGGPAGVIVKNGYIVAEWGDIERADMTFSIAKSYLATVAGLALDRGLIRSLDDRVADYMPPEDDGFASPHNAPITWRMLLQQTSEWEGTLWGKPDRADRRRGQDRELQAPGTFWEYNDVRVNRTALSLLRVWRRPLPEVLKELVMDPIGASDTWEWHGYHNSYVEIDGRRVQSVSGGGHWGGGFFISTLDHARFGYLHLRRGEWDGQRILSERWIDEATTPSELNPRYGLMWWLNTDRRQYPSAPESSFFALGAGNNVIWVDPEHDLVVVVRWIEGRAVDGLIARVLRAVQTPAASDEASASDAAFTSAAASR